MQEVSAIEKISDQISKLVDLVSKVRGGGPGFPHGVQGPDYSLVAHLTWDEDGELSID
jgi:hypothetical protein